MFVDSKLSDTWTITGFCEMQNGIRGITRHENNEEHKNAEKSWLQWLRGGRVDHKLVEMRNAKCSCERK